MAGTPFEGRWRIDLEGSTMWDPGRGAYVPDPVGEEKIRIGGDSEVQDYEVLYGDRPVVRMGYVSRFDAPEWVPYTIRGVDGVAPEDVDRELDAFRVRIASPTPFRLGGVYGLVRSVYVDAMTHYRLSRSVETGAAEYCMMRRMEADLSAYVATVLRVDGRVHKIRRFVRDES